MEQPELEVALIEYKLRLLVVNTSDDGAEHVAFVRTPVVFTFIVPFK